MSRKAKLISRFLSRPKDFTWDELVTMMAYLGYYELQTGKTGGSRRKFINDSGSLVNLHKPHPSKVLKTYAMDQILDLLKEENIL